MPRKNSFPFQVAMAAIALLEEKDDWFPTAANIEKQMYGHLSKDPAALAMLPSKPKRVEKIRGFLTRAVLPIREHGNVLNDDDTVDRVGNSGYRAIPVNKSFNPDNPELLDRLADDCIHARVSNRFCRLVFVRSSDPRTTLLFEASRQRDTNNSAAKCARAIEQIDDAVEIGLLPDSRPQKMLAKTQNFLQTLSLKELSISLTYKKGRLLERPKSARRVVGAAHIPAHSKKPSIDQTEKRRHVKRTIESLRSGEVNPT